VLAKYAANPDPERDVGSDVRLDAPEVIAN
jgi:hypothetical protein